MEQGTGTTKHLNKSDVPLRVNIHVEPPAPAPAVE